MPRLPPFPDLPKRVFVPLADTGMVPAALDQEGGRQAIERHVRHGALRPFDIGAAEIEEPLALWMPFWRIAVTFAGLEATLQIADPQPDRALLVAAREAFPHEPRLPTVSARLQGSAPLQIPRDAVVPADAAELEENGAVVVQPDVELDEARATASRLVEGLPSLLRAELGASWFVLYPIYYARYAYRGEARRAAGVEEHAVAVSGVTGELVAGDFPSPMRALAARLRRALSFDYRP